ncbi:hypothetical protein JTE90_007937 [Oedothorax gibbosus]|uniref:Uncharacterized protein n=1 Tax=Oedothorax gibbosus TaxID=931172 RepID=A0AAV6VHH4_9ARAC|nr:hypothetical protein JTE90_007937 [Oedothorax gibbosus]
MQEFTKILVFLSTLLSTLSADASFNWKKHSTKHPFKGSQVRVHGRMMVESDDSPAEPSSGRSHQIGQISFFDPHKDMQRESKKISNSEMIDTIQPENNAAQVFEGNEQVPPKKSFSKQADKYLKDTFPITIPAQPAWQLPVLNINKTPKSDKQLKILPISSIHDLWFATKRILMSESQHSNLSDILTASNFRNQTNGIIPEDDYILSRKPHIAGTQRPEMVDSQVYGPTSIETSTFSTVLPNPSSKTHYYKSDNSFTDNLFYQKDSLHTSNENKYPQSSTLTDKYHLKLTDGHRTPNSILVDANNHLKAFEVTEPYSLDPTQENKIYLTDFTSYQLKHAHANNSYQPNFRSHQLEQTHRSDNHQPYDSSNQFLKNTHGNESHQPNFTSLDDKSIQMDRNASSYQNATKGDTLDTAESRGMSGWQNGGGGGGQPILLIKDSGDKGGDSMKWENGGGGMTTKDTVGPLIMMLTPLIMMCIMMPMMMSVMGGMMNFMKSVASMMMMLNMPGTMNPTGTLVNKHRKTGEEGEGVARGRVFLGSLILEAMDKLEAAISKYESPN